MFAMGMVRRCVWTAVMAGALAAQTSLPPETALLARIKAHEAENLARLPNYTCLQTIERSVRAASSRSFEPEDRVRLEVAYIGKKELFAWPGAGEFEEQEVTQMIEGGVRSTGSFAMHTYNVFLSNAPAFTYKGEETLLGLRTIRYDYRVPRSAGAYEIRVPPEGAKLGFSGSFWVNAETLDLVRLTVSADDVPPELGIKEAVDVVDYSRAQIGDASFLLPAASEVSMTDSTGAARRNRSRFTGCRQYTARSVVSFGEVPLPGEPTNPAKAAELTLPAGLDVNLILETGINTETSAVGDRVTAKVFADVKRNRAVVIPKGAIATGRITALERGTQPRTHYLLSLRFPWLVFGTRRAEFLARLEAVTSPTGASTYQTGSLRIPYSPASIAYLSLSSSEQKPGLGVLRLLGDRVQLVPGLRMIWRTETKEAE